MIYPPFTEVLHMVEVNTDTPCFSSNSSHISSRYTSGMLLRVCKICYKACFNTADRGDKLEDLPQYHLLEAFNIGWVICAWEYQLHLSYCGEQGWPWSFVCWCLPWSIVVVVVMVAMVVVMVKGKQLPIWVSGWLAYINHVAHYHRTDEWGSTLFLGIILSR